MIELAEARSLVCARIPAGGMPAEEVTLDHAVDRICASVQCAPRDLPGFANSAMDGFALRAADLAADTPTRLRVRAILLAGGAPVSPVTAGECVRIMTGAAVPQGADTVVVLENSVPDGSEHVRIQPGTARGANIRPADDDMAAGALAVAAGARLDAASIGVLASLGLATIAVRRQPRVGVLVTGDELLPVGVPLGYGQRYDSNRVMLQGLLGAHGAQVVDARRCGDERALQERNLRELCASSDWVVTTGGASAGDADFMPELVASLGERVFWKVAIRPGMPLLFGIVEGTPVFCLPGNPVSVFTCFMAILRPALARVLAAPSIDPPPLPAVLLEPIAKRHARREFRRAQLSVSALGHLQVLVHAATSSAALGSLAQSNALVELAEPPRAYAAGELVAVHPLGNGSWMR
jgi:molybdopterin molybdotransferase